MASNIKINKIHTFTGTGAPADGDQLVLNDSQHPVGSIYVDDSGIVYNRTQANKVAADWASSSGSSSYLVASVELTDAQIKALPTTPIEIVAAPGANKRILPIMGLVYGDFSAGTYTANADSSWEFNFTVPGLSASCVIPVQNYLQSASKISIVFPFPAMQVTGNVTLTPLIESLGATSYLDNLSLYFGDIYAGVSNYTGGNAANTLKVTVYYVVVDL